jgi:DDE family transposase
VTVDLDATLGTAHTDTEWAARTWKKGYGCHPRLGYVATPKGTVAALPRRGNAGSNTTADRISVLDDALAQLPKHVRAGDEQGKRGSWLTDAAGATQGFTKHVAELGMQFSVGAYLHQFDIPTVLPLIPKHACTPAYDAECTPRDGAWVTEITGMADLSAWPEGTRLILRTELPGAQALHRHRRAARHRISHQHHRRATRQPGTAVPPPRPHQGPPRRQRHRPA